MNKLFISALLISGSVTTVFGAPGPERFAVKLKGDIELTGAYTTDFDFPAVDASNSMHRFGVEFGWSFLNSESHSLELGIGLNFGLGTFDIGSNAVSYSYTAPPSADMDGNSYIRHTDLSAMQQSLSISRTSVPVYLQYNFHLNNRFLIYGKVGFETGFGGKISARKISGTVDSYGVFPEYDNLVIAEPWLNGFGKQTLTKEQCTGGASGKTDFDILAGAGISFRIFKPLHIFLGINYRAGLSDMLNNQGLKYASGDVNQADAPSIYTVADGVQWRPLTDGLTKCRLNRLGLDIGFELRF